MCAVLRLVGHGHGHGKEEKMSYIGIDAELILDITKNRRENPKSMQHCSKDLQMLISNL